MGWHLLPCPRQGNVRVKVRIAGMLVVSESLAARGKGEIHEFERLGSGFHDLLKTYTHSPSALIDGAAAKRALAGSNFTRTCAQAELSTQMLQEAYRTPNCTATRRCSFPLHRGGVRANACRERARHTLICKNETCDLMARECTRILCTKQPSSCMHPSSRRRQPCSYTS